MKTQNKVKLSKRYSSAFGIFNLRKLTATNIKQKLTNRWHLSAEGFLLLPSALRPHLLGSIKYISISLILIIQSCFITPVLATDNSEPTAPGVNPDINKETSGSTTGSVDSNVNTSKKGEATIGESNGPNLTLTIPSKLSLDLNPNTNNGFASSSSNISISTTAPWGYELSIKAKDDNTLKNNSGSSSTLASITNPIDEATFKSGADYVNKWGFKPSKVNGGDNTNYIAGPTTSPIVIEKTSANNDSPTQYNIAIGVKADSTITPGVYSNNFILAATANTVSYNITYNLNSGSWTGTNPQSGSTTESSINISSITPTRADYAFEGWCSVVVTNNDSSSPTCSGTKYTVNANYTLSNGSNALNLYAMWKSTIPSMQNWTGCSALTQDNGSNGNNIYVTLKDERDGNKYKVAKLKDGKCWMVESLRLGDDKLINRTLTSTNTDITASTYQLTAQTPLNFNRTNNGGYDADALYIDPAHPEYGGYYSWHTATAGTGNSSMSSSASNAASSICPKGWKLPTGGSKSDFYDLSMAYGGIGEAGVINLMATPVPGFLLSCNIENNGNGLNCWGNGGYWSSTARRANDAYFMGIFKTSSYYSNSNDLYYGYSIRCVAAL